MDLEKWEEEAKKEGMDELYKKKWADDSKESHLEYKQISSSREESLVPRMALVPRVTLVRRKPILI
jgi:hypothetical protein